MGLAGDQHVEPVPLSSGTIYFVFVAQGILMPVPPPSLHEPCGPQSRVRGRRSVGCLALGGLTLMGNLTDCYRKAKLHEQDVDPCCVTMSESLTLCDMCLLLTIRTPVGLHYTVGQADHLESYLEEGRRL